MEATSIVKVVAAFVAGIVVALGSALIYMRVADMGHAPSALQASATATTPTELPEAGGDTATPRLPAPVIKPEPKPLEPKRFEVHPVSKPAFERKRTFVAATPSKPVRKPIEIAQNDPKPILRMPAPAPAMTEALPTQTAVDTVQAQVQNPPVQDQASTDMPAVTQPQVTSPPPPQPHVVTLPAGTILSIRLGEMLSTDRNYTGDTFRATLLAPVIMDGFIIADKDSKVLGRVVNAQSSSHMTNVAGLSLAVTEINTTDGQRVQVHTDVYQKRGSSNAGQNTAKIAGGAALGAIIGGVAGGGKGAAVGAGVGGAAGTGAVLLSHNKPATIENETQLTFHLSTPVTITEKLN